MDVLKPLLEMTVTKATLPHGIEFEHALSIFTFGTTRFSTLLYRYLQSSCVSK